MKVFWSWQNDYSPSTCRHFIRDALAEAVTQAASNLELEDADRPELDHDTKGTPGMADVAATILAKISNSAAFVADLTPIGASNDGKALPNPNVLIELGWAMQRPGIDRIIAILNLANGWTVENLPFDIRHRYVLTYSLKETADSKTREAVHEQLVHDICGAIELTVGQHLEASAATAEIRGVTAKQGDRSIWGTAKDTLSHSDSFGRDHITTVALSHQSGSFIRLIPGGWRANKPAIADVARLGPETVVDPPPEGTSGGNFGATEEGFVRYWITGERAAGQDETSNVVMYFDETGEFWMIHGTIVGQFEGTRMLRDRALLGYWSKFIRKGLAVFNRFGALEARKVEAGLFGMQGVHWFAQWVSERVPARRNSVVHVHQSRDWSRDAQLVFMTTAYNEVLNLFGLPRLEQKSVQEILRQYDEEGWFK
jgi:hypothetical protein